ncbi:hypothetical protein [Delftia phage PhiW-14]|uniref:Uncharacterized protein n=1 Tax=Delftia phage PhiW-14 TaxID=665032 RepID=C9DFX5_BPW14|nr:hypothetical protein DP-phiW-14_gp003 [Delftia phage PhiW-14]ACV50026.1 hypothetical protein [Delftia phage PhiW-14]
MEAYINTNSPNTLDDIIAQQRGLGYTKFRFKMSSDELWLVCSL